MTPMAMISIVSRVWGLSVANPTAIDSSLATNVGIARATSTRSRSGRSSSNHSGKDRSTVSATSALWCHRRLVRYARLDITNGSLRSPRRARDSHDGRADAAPVVDLEEPPADHVVQFSEIDAYRFCRLLGGQGDLRSFIRRS